MVLQSPDLDKTLFRNGRGRLFRGRVLLSVWLLFVMLLGSGCQSLPLPWTFTTPSYDNTLNSEAATLDTTSGKTSTTTRRGSESTASQKSSQTTTASKAQSADAAFSARVTSLIVAGLGRFEQKIVLDDAFTGYQIPKREADATIARVYDLYETVYRQDPQFYWLDGSARLTYSFSSGLTSHLSSMTLELGYLAAFDQASPATLRLRQQAMMKAARAIAAVARQKTEPWQQLQVIHDKLVRTIVYDEKLDQNHNNAASALLDHLSMCQGYAQAFQLVARELDFKVQLISGKAFGIDHAWNLVWLAGKPYHVDVTHDDPVPDGGTNDLVEHIHFLRSDAIMRETHTWVAKDYPACPSDGAQYYRKQKLTASSPDVLRSKIEQFIAAANLTDNKPEQLELLYTAAGLPKRQTVESMIVDSLSSHASVHSISYRLSLSKQVMVLEILPPG